MGVPGNPIAKPIVLHKMLVHFRGVPRRINFIRKEMPASLILNPYGSYEISDTVKTRAATTVERVLSMTAGGG